METISGIHDFYHNNIIVHRTVDYSQICIINKIYVNVYIYIYTHITMVIVIVLVTIAIFLFILKQNHELALPL